MKRYFFMLVILAFCFSTYADVDIKTINRDTTFPHDTLVQLLRDKFEQHNTDIAAVDNKGTGDIYYVDSGVTTAGAGESWVGAKATLDEAVALCSDNNGDIIYIAQGHTETWTAVNSADLDVIGITVIGLGTGSDRPTFTYTTATAGELVMAAANVTIRNLVFQSGIADVVHAIEVEDDADGSIIEFCEFLSGTTDAYEFVDCIEVAAAADDLIIRYNKATETTAGAASWLDIAAGIVDNLSLYGNEIYGDYATSVVDGTGRIHTLGYYGYNTITNLNADEYAFYFNAAATGIIEHNTIYTDAEATSIDPGSMSCFENYVSTTTDKSGMIYPAPDTGSTQLNATTVTAIATAVDALSGIGMIGLCETNATTTTVISGALGGYGNDVFNEGWSLVCIFDTGGAVGTLPSGEIRDVTDYVSATGTFTTAAWTAALTAGDYVYLVKIDHLNPHVPALSGTSSNIWYCDDGGSNGEGTSWQTAKTTIVAAEALCSAGDIIYVGANHNENLTGAADLTVDVAGVSIIGMGKGNDRPLFDSDDATAVITLDNAGITLKNLRFRPGVTIVTIGVRVEDAGIGCVIENCAFVDGEAAGTDEFVDAVSVDTLAADLTVKNCTYYSTGTNTNTFVNLDEATIANATVEDCTVFGAFAEAGIWWGAAVPTNLRVENNVVTNTTSGQMCIEGSGNATGMCVDNQLSGDTYGSILDPGYMRCHGNTQTIGTDRAAIEVPLVAGKTYALTKTDGTADGDDLFSVAGGPILITSFTGYCVTAIGGTVTTTIILDHATDADREFSSAVDIDALAGGGLIIFTEANPAVLTIVALGANAGASQLMDPWYCPAGMIENTNDNASQTGVISWSMTFIPLTENVVVIPQ